MYVRGGRLNWTYKREDCLLISKQNKHSALGYQLPLKTPPLFCQSPPLNLQTVQAPFLGNPPSSFFGELSPPKSCIFQKTPEILKFFILDPILSFKSN